MEGGEGGKREGGVVWCDEACSLTWACCHLIFFCEGSSSHVVDHWHSSPYMDSSFHVYALILYMSPNSVVYSMKMECGKMQSILTIK